MAKSCTKRITDTNVKVEEHRRKAIFVNPSRSDYDVTTIDGCLISSGPRCDYLVTKLGSTSIFVELKGRDVDHACKQIIASIENQSVRDLCEEKIGFLVICNKFPRFDTAVAKAKQLAAKKFNAGFHVVCNKGQFEIERVASITGPK